MNQNLFFNPDILYHLISLDKSYLTKIFIFQPRKQIYINQSCQELAIITQFRSRNTIGLLNVLKTPQKHYARHVGQNFQSRTALLQTSVNMLEGTNTRKHITSGKDSAHSFLCSSLAQSQTLQQPDIITIITHQLLPAPPAKSSSLENQAL